MKRAGLYIRVSHEEQALHGYSLKAQRERLESYVQQKGYIIYDIYTDEGYSARTALHRRKEFMRLMHDIKANHIDVILFIKLDRWFRNVKDFYTYESILENHHVTWETTDEDYNTSTAQGRLYLNIKLSIAQNESDMTSERIKFVFAHKRSKGEAVSGKLPLGYQIVDKHIVPDDKGYMIPLLFQFYKEHESIQQTMLYLRNNFHINRTYQAISKLLRNPKYLGVIYNGITYIPPLVDSKLFNEVQEQLNAHKPVANHSSTYLFRGLLCCPHCGHKLSGFHRYYKNKIYTYYQCSEASHNKLCSHRKLYNEETLEKQLLPSLYENYPLQSSLPYEEFLNYYHHAAHEEKQSLWQEYFQPYTPEEVDE